MWRCNCNERTQGAHACASRHRCKRLALVRRRAVGGVLDLELDDQLGACDHTRHGREPCAPPWPVMLRLVVPAPNPIRRAARSVLVPAGRRDGPRMSLITTRTVCTRSVVAMSRRKLSTKASRVREPSGRPATPTPAPRERFYVRLFENTHTKKRSRLSRVPSLCLIHSCFHSSKNENERNRHAAFSGLLDFVLHAPAVALRSSRTFTELSCATAVTIQPAAAQLSTFVCTRC